MIGNIVPISGAQAKQYPFQESQGYYIGQEHDMMPPTFGGSLAGRLGLASKGFDKALYERGIDGDFDSALTITRENNVKRAAYDITVSAPKSVSIVGLVTGDDRVVQAHNEANAAAMAELEKYVKYSIKENGRLVTLDARGIAYTTFGHVSSRERRGSSALDDPDIIVGPGGDPALHSHNIVFKFVLGQDGQLRALENSELLAARKMVDMHYKKVLADKLQKFGYQIEHTKDGFEIAGVGKDLMNYLSSGKNSIDRSLAQQGLTRETSTSAQRDITNYEERVSKRHYEIDELQDWWKKRISSERHVLPTVDDLTIHGERHPDPSVKMTAQEAVNASITGLTERSVSIKHRYVIAEEAMRASNLLVDLDSINQEIDTQIACGLLLRRNDQRSITSKLLVDTERSLVEFYQSGLEIVAPLTSYDKAVAHIAAAEERLRSETSDGKFTQGQREMVLASATSTDAIKIVVGDAGTGKSVAVSALYAAAKDQGYTVLGLAPLNRAVTALQESIPDGQTLQSALHSPKFWTKVNEDTLIVLDEAGLVDSRNMKLLLEKLEKKRRTYASENPGRPVRGPRIVLVGDDKQYSPVESGYSFYQLKELAAENGSLSRLSEMRRGSEEKKYNGLSIGEAHNMARDRPEKLLATLNQAGLVTALGSEKSRRAYIGREYAKLSPAMQNKSLVLTGTNANRIALNHAIREKIALGRGVMVETFERGDLTKIAMKNAANYDVGDFLRVTIADRADGYKKGDFLEVVGKQGVDRILIKKNGAHEITVFNPSKSGHRVSIGQCEKIEISQGELIRFTAKMEALGVANGDRGRVTSINNESKTMKVELVETGLEIVVNLRDRGLSARYGYSSTGHSTQGVTAGGNVYKYVTSEDATTNRNSEYTDLTRSKVHYEIVTDAIEGERIEKLTHAMSREHVKESALVTPATLRPAPKFKLYDETGFEHIEILEYSNKKLLSRALEQAAARFKSIRVVGGNDFRFAVAMVGLGNPLLKFKDRKTLKLMGKLKKAAAARTKPSDEGLATARTVSAKKMPKKEVQNNRIDSPSLERSDHSLRSRNP